MARTIVLTGGGSAGHVTVNLALIPYFQKKGWNVHYIGSRSGIERELVADLSGVTYHSIATGKLRRYFDWNNVKDPFRVIRGVWQAYRLLRKLKPAVVFSKGGFVAVPVVIGAWLNRIPVVIHESDLTPGLANRLSIPFAKRVCTTFPETVEYVGTGKAVHVGAVVREELFHGSAAKGRELCRFVPGKPVLLIMGGSLGSQKINQTVRSNLTALTKSFQIVHLCGKGNVDPSLESRGYRQFEYIREELPDLLALADVVVSRAGSNSIHEFLALQKPMLLIPLSRAASRGDQIANARSFEARGYAQVLEEEELSGAKLLESIRKVYDSRDKYITAMKRGAETGALQKLIGIIEGAADGR